MVAPLGRFTLQIYALLRIIAGLMFMMHGTQKLFGWPGGTPPFSPASLPGVAGIIEAVGGFLITIGLFAGPAAFISSGLMAVAYFMAHAPGGFFPTINKGESAVVYCFLWLFVSSVGSGIWSVDSAMRRGRPIGGRV